MFIVMGAIFFLSHQPGDAFDLPPLFPGDDKLAHMVIYGVLAAAIIFSFQPLAPEVRRRREKRWLIVAIVVLVATLYGISDEFHQSFIPGRSPSIFDVAADVAGALIVSLFWLHR